METTVGHPISVAPGVAARISAEGPVATVSTTSVAVTIVEASMINGAEAIVVSVTAGPCQIAA